MYRPGVKRGAYQPIEMNEDMVFKRKIMPEENLMLAVLIQAIQDFVKNPLDRILLNYFYLDHDLDYLYSFNFICNYFGWDIKNMREKIENLDYRTMKQNIINYRTKEINNDYRTGDTGADCDQIYFSPRVPDCMPLI